MILTRLGNPGNGQSGGGCPVDERKSGIRGKKSEGPDRVELGKPVKGAWVLVHVRKDSTEIL